MSPARTVLVSVFVCAASLATAADLRFLPEKEGRRPAGLNGVPGVLAAAPAPQLPPLMSALRIARKGDKVKTVSVDCSKGKSINKALEDKADVLVVEVHGMCHETVVVVRGRVTLKGADPAVDGIESCEPLPDGSGNETTLTIRGAEYVRVENLTVRGGFHGLFVRDAGSDTPFGYGTQALVEVAGCRIEDNAAWGIFAEDAFVSITDTLITRNGGGFMADHAWAACERCDLLDNRSWATYASRAGYASIRQSTVVAGERGNGLYAVGGSNADAHESSITASHWAAATWVDGLIDMYHTTFSGRLIAHHGGGLWIVGSTQTESSGGNYLYSNGWIETWGYYDGENVFPTTLVNGVGLEAFSKAMFWEQTTVDGSVTCSSGGDAWVDASVAVTGGVHGCDHVTAP